VLAPKGEASPILAFAGAGRAPAASPPIWEARPWPRHEAGERIRPAAKASPAALGGGGSGLGLGLLIRRRPAFASAPLAPVANPVAPRPSEPHGAAPAAACRTRTAARRQLTVRLPFDQFHRFHDLARRDGRTYQNVLATATHAYLEQLESRR